MPLDERDEARLRDMVLYSRNAIDLLGGVTFEAMETNLAVKLALARCIEVIGEAGHQVSEPTRTRIPTVPWHAMWGMRNRLIHDYGNTDFRIVFKVVCEELPGLRRTLETFLAAESKPPAAG